MAYDDRYVDRNTMKGSCQVSLTGTYPNSDEVEDTPGQPAGTKFLGPGEDISTRIANRTRYQLALNCDVLKDRLDSMIAVAKVERLVGFSGDTITIDPTNGGGHTIDFDGYLYVGNSTDYTYDQPSLDTLFQVLDDQFNEVLVDGEEVRVNVVAPVGAQPGNGFYDAGVVTLTLNHPLPSGNYRLAYARDGSLATLPDDALIRADIRGLHEAAAESAFKSAMVVAEDTTLGPADFIGASALESALQYANALGGGCVIFVRPGNYTFSGSFDLTADNVKVLGASANLIGGAVINLTGGAYDFTVSAPFVYFEDVVFGFTAGHGLRWNDSFGMLVNVAVTGELDIASPATNFVGSSVTVLSTGVSIPLRLDNVTEVSFSNSTFESEDVNCLLLPGINNRIKFDNCTFESRDATCMNVTARSTYANFSNCKFEARDGLALYIGQGKLSQSEFHSCHFKSTPQTLTSAGIIDTYVPAPGSSSFQGVLFSRCMIENPDGTARYRNPAVRFVSTAPDSGEKFGPQFIECSIRDDACGFEDGIGGGVPGVQLIGVYAEDLTINFANVPDMREDGPVASLTDCVMNGLYVLVHAPATSIATVSRAAVEVYRGCRINKLVIYGAGGEWARPALLVEGDTGGMATPPPYQNRFSVVDSLEIQNYGVTHWHVASSLPLVAEVAGFGVLRRFVWGANSVGAELGTSSSINFTMIMLTGDQAEVSGCHIDLNSGGTTKRYLQHLIAINGEAIDYVRIRDNYLRVVDGKSANQATRSVIRVIGPSSGVAYAGLIEGNYIDWLDDAVASPSSIAIISSSNNAYMWKITNNHIWVDDISAGLGYLIYWETTPATWPTGAGGTIGAGAVITNNTLYNNNNAGAGGNITPAIAGAGGVTTFIGVSDNLLGRS